MNELSYNELSPENQAIVAACVPKNPKQCRFQVNGDGSPFAYRFPTAYTGKKAVKWGPLLDLATHEATGMPVSDPVESVAPAPSLENAVAELGPKVTTAAAMVQAETAIQMIPHNLIDRCPLNPRHTFSRERLDELKQSFREHRFVKEMSHLWLRPSPTQHGRFELVDGERRWIVVGELIEEEMFGGLMPSMVSELSDAQVLEFALINALQREELSPMEEAEAVCRLLELPKADGSLPTAVEIAGHLGFKPMRMVRYKLLRKLKGTPAGDAVESGALSEKHGETLARVADSRKRAELTKRVLNPSDKRGALPVETLQQWIKDEVQISLGTADFDLTDAELVPLKTVDGERVCGGACADKLEGGGRVTQWQCPFVEVETGKAMCMNPGCFKAKQAGLYDGWCAQMQIKGYKTLPAAEAERMWDDSGKRVIANAGLVEIDASPEEWELKESAMLPQSGSKWQMADGKIAKWKTLLKGMRVEVLALKDRTGGEHLLVNREQAKAAAVENGYDIFRGQKTEPAPQHPTSNIQHPTSNGEDMSEGDPRIEAAARDVKLEAERLAEQARREREARIAERHEHLLTRALIDQTRGLKHLDLSFWRLVLAPMAETVKENEGLLLTCLALGLTEKDIEAGMTDDDLSAWLDETIRETPAVHLPSVALVLSRHMLYESEVEQWMKLAAKTFGVDAKKVQKQAVAEVAAEIAVEEEQREIAEGIVWVNPIHRDKALEFEWDEGGICTVPNIATVKMPKAAAKWEMSIATARAAKGWAFGFALYHSKNSDVASPNRNEAIYDNEALAIKAALLALQKAMENHQAPEPALARMAAYIANVKLPEAPPQKKKSSAKKAKGARK